MIRGGASPVQPLCGPGRHGYRTQMAQNQRGVDLAAFAPGSIAVVGRHRDRETQSHRRTRRSGKGGTKSKNDNTQTDQLTIYSINLYVIEINAYDFNKICHQNYLHLLVCTDNSLRKVLFVGELTFLGKR